MLRSLLLLALFIFFTGFSFSQHRSIHQEQNDHFRSLGELSVARYDSINAFKGLMPQSEKNDCFLERIVFGYHPYWAGSAYLNYQWELLSDMAFFSYEVDPSTGSAVTTHSFLTSPAVDSALANETRVHLCLTLFSSHGTFFTNPTAMQNMIDEVIYYVVERNAHGVNVDFELVPSAYSDEFMNFIAELSSQLKATVSDAIMSIALPAIDWGNVYNITFLNDYIDYYMIMAYEYYWQGSSQAGPVSPLYSMTASYNRSVARTATDYQSSDMPANKIILGLPYFGRQWKTDQQFAPANTLATGTAHTYEYIRDNSSGFYNSDNLYWEPNSFSPYYSFYNDDWYQCFHPGVRELGYRYDLINYRNFAGPGIWALSYDDGYTDLWQLIENKFSDCSIPKTRDTIYDSGGPSWNYYNNEDYLMIISSPGASSIRLWFEQFDLEAGYDSLWVYDGPDITYPLLASLSGNITPDMIQSGGSALILHFYSDGATTKAGWEAVWEADGVGAVENEAGIVEIFPNPAVSFINFRITIPYSKLRMRIFDMNGKIVKSLGIHQGKTNYIINVSDLVSGVYFVTIKSAGKLIGQRKLIVL